MCPRQTKSQGRIHMPKDHGIGASPKRREDVRFLTGAGNYTDDINVAGQAYVYFLRSDIAHGTIKSIDTGAAAAMPSGPRSSVHLCSVSRSPA